MVAVTRLSNQGNFYLNNGIMDETSSIPQVTDSLQLYWDAGIPESYPGSGTTVYDLSPNKFNGTLTINYNGTSPPLFSTLNKNSFWFAGMPPGVTSSSAPAGWQYGSINFANATPNSLKIYQKDFTISSWALCQNTLLTQPNGNLYSFNGNAVAGGEYSLGWFAGYLTAGMYGTSSYTYIDTGNVWKNYVHTYSYNGPNSVSRVYVNGSLVTTQTNLGYMTSSVQNSPLVVGDAYLGGGFLQGYLANMMIYNRVLSDTEVASNFNATRNRFGV
jgi:hypothetical protein